MAIKTLSGAFEKAGYELANPRNQWSAVKSDGRGVAVTVWSDEIDKAAEPWEMDLRGHPRLTVWMHKPGNTTRKKHIRHALSNCGGKVDLILCKAVDVKADTRTVEWARPWPERFGLVLPDEFDEVTGEFRLQLLPVVT